MVAYKKEFKGVPSALTFLTSDGITGAHIVNGKIVAKGSEYDGKDATEKNLLTAADYTGYDLPKTDLSKYMKGNVGYPVYPKTREFNPGNMPAYPQGKLGAINRGPAGGQAQGTMMGGNVGAGFGQRQFGGQGSGRMGPAGGAGINKNMLVKLATMSKLFPGLVT